MDKTTKTHKRKRVNLLILTVFILLIMSVVSYYWYMYSIANKFNNAVYPNVSIENIDMSGKTKEEVLEYFLQKYDKPLENGSINVKVKDKLHNLPYKELSIRYNIEEVVNEAFLYGKNLSVSERYKLIKKGKNTNYNLSLTYNDEPIRIFLEGIDKTLPKEIMDSSIKKVNNGFQVTQEKTKEEIDKEQGFKEIVGKIEERLYTIDLEMPVKYVEPKITAKQLKTIDSVISSFKTKFIISERATNIMLATKAASDVLLMPGDTYSFNELVGDTTPDKGYKEAPIIKNKKLEPGYGGGVCQVSTTLHNAVLRAGIVPIERMHHSMPVAYVPKGADATVFYKAVDYKFTNTLNYPIYIHGYIVNDEVIFDIYSNSSLKSKTYDIESEIYKEIPRKVKYIKDLSLDEGEQVIDSKGSDGFRVRVYRISYENGKKINKGLLYDDYYKPVDKIVKENL